jgi:AcrR family transcriptional regulator
MDKQSDTRNKILQAALVLIRKKGFKGATTRAIAEEAGVNEVTLFRHFKNKAGLIEAIFEQFSYVPALSKTIKEKSEGDLEKDLYLFAKLYFQLLMENGELILISLKESELTPSLDQEVIKIPKQLKESLMSYFTKMKNEGKLIETNIEAQALTFIWMIFGYFQSTIRYGNQITKLSAEEFIKNSVKVFARGLRP